jgi:hypothetical protein
LCFVARVVDLAGRRRGEFDGVVVVERRGRRQERRRGQTQAQQDKSTHHGSSSVQPLIIAAGAGKGDPIPTTVNFGLDRRPISWRIPPIKSDFNS